MKNTVLALTLAMLSLASVPSFANEAMATDVEVDQVSVELEEGDFAKVDDAIWCSVAMVNRRNRIVRRYNGQRSLRSWRCERPMRNCLRDLRFRRFSHRCVELRH